MSSVMTSKQTKVVGITLAAVLLALVATTVVTTTTTTAYALQNQENSGSNNAKHFGGISNQYHFVAYGNNAIGQQGR
jgi:hypothetical protein